MNDLSGTLDGAIAPVENRQLFGHDAALTFITETYRTGHLHHALLLEGPRGIGKATLAFHVARYILSNPDPSQAPTIAEMPSENDALIRQMASGASHDLLHLTRPIDAKSGRIKTAITVDEVRRAGHFFAQTSGTGNWRILVVDAADDMNRSAANAILKVLEEPPRRSLFLLISHAPGTLLPTIRSRCMPLRLEPLGDTDMRLGIAHLGLDAGQSTEVLETVISRAEGSLANAVLLLRYGGLEIAEAADQILRDGPSASKPAIHALADSLTGKDRETAFAYLTDHLLESSRLAARRAAQRGDVATADQWARLAVELDDDLTAARIYNLDRKQTVLGLFSSIFRVSSA